MESWRQTAEPWPWEAQLLDTSWLNASCVCVFVFFFLLWPVNSSYILGASSKGNMLGVEQWVGQLIRILMLDRMKPHHP